MANSRGVARTLKTSVACLLTESQAPILCLMSDLDFPHRGTLVRQNCLERFELSSVTEGARVLGVSRQALTNLLSGKAGISPEMAHTRHAHLQITVELEKIEVPQPFDDRVVHRVFARHPGVGKPGVRPAPRGRQTGCSPGTPG
ncbi:hypothetical protein SBC2_77370 (plasmid) [Caballeronia sp. SBC2]|nr:hypothetical protein SBC2_77370 [Caballeronia sp. SBC2]